MDFINELNTNKNKVSMKKLEQLPKHQQGLMMQITRVIEEKFDEKLKELKTFQIQELKNEGFEYISKEKVFELLDIKDGTLDKWLNNGLLKRSMIGRKIYFHIDDLRTIMINHSQDKANK